MAQVDYFLKFDETELWGESTDDKHRDAIDVESWSWGATQVGTTTGGTGGGAGRVSIQDFNFVARTNKASPRLFLRCASGKHVTKAVLTARKSGGQQEDFLTLTMSDVLISSYQTAGSETADTVPLDQVSLNFSKIEFVYRTQKADGSLGAPTKANWDVETNKGS